MCYFSSGIGFLLESSHTCLKERHKILVAFNDKLSIKNQIPVQWAITVGLKRLIAPITQANII